MTSPSAPTTPAPARAEPAGEKIRSYASHKSPAAALRDGLRLVRSASVNRDAMANQAAKGLALAQRMCDEAAAVCGFPIRNKRTLEIGSGPLPAQLAFLAHHNDATGIDLDVHPHGFQPAAYFTILKRNGPTRLLKTITRKALGVDRAFWREINKGLGRPSRPPFNALYMDATRMTFPDNSFDLVSSYDTLEHIPTLAEVLTEIKRVLRPGCVSHHVFHPITAFDGIHDLRIIAGRHEGIPYWAHLRAQHQHAVQASAFLNHFRLDQYRDIFNRCMPGATLTVRRYDDPEWAADPAAREVVAQHKALRAAGELAEFSDEELLAQRMVAIWKKPA